MAKKERDLSQYTAHDEKENEVMKDSDESKDSKGSEGKERINYRRSNTPVPDDEDRILKEVQDNGQTVKTKEGTVRFLDRKKGIEAKDYYHGLLPCEDIKTLLKQNGDFCVRTTEIKSGDDRQMCLSVRWENKLRHFLLHSTPNNTWAIDLNSEKSPQFSSIEGLIDFYADYKQPFSEYNCRLFTPVHRQRWEFRHAQIELEKKLGEGAFGEVYAGYVNTRSKRNKAAIKTLKCEHVTKDKIEESMAEARLMRRLFHPNVVRFFGVAAEDEPLMIIMEYVQGGSLDSFLEKQAETDIEVSVKMCLDAARGLEYLHGKGILHRDLAARNCLYAKPTLKISDFGMARAAAEYQIVQRERAPIRWMAPEVLVTKVHTPPSDVWSLGVLFWEIFNHAQEPYEGWPFGKVRREVTKNFYHLSLPDSAPDALKEVMEKIWSVDPLTRISSKKVARSLEAICPNAESLKERSKQRKGSDDSFEADVEVTKEEQEASANEEQDNTPSKAASKVSTRKTVKENMENQGKSKMRVLNKVSVHQSIKKLDKSEESKSKAARSKVKKVESKPKNEDLSKASSRRQVKRAKDDPPADNDEDQSSRKKKKTVPSNHSEHQEDKEDKSRNRVRRGCKTNTPTVKKGQQSKNGESRDTSIRVKKAKKKKSARK